MGEKAVQSWKKEEFLEASFYYLIEHGLDNVSLRELCKKTGISMGSVYYWFDGKDGIFIEAAEYGLRLVADKIFDHAFASMGDLDEYFNTVHERISVYEKELRFIYQVATSPIYGERMRATADYLSEVYDAYAHKLAEQLGCPFELIQPITYIFIAEVLDYIVWGDLEKSKRQVAFCLRLFRRGMEICAEEKKQD